jgi:TonB family protein
MKGKILIAVIILVSMGLASLDVYSQKDGSQKKYVERVYEPGNFSKNFNRLPKLAEVEKVLSFGVEGAYREGTTQTVLEEAQVMSDIISKYPTHIQTARTVIEISDAEGMNKRSASGINEQLTSEQITLIKSASLEDELKLIVNFNAENVITGKTEERELMMRLTVIPEVEAEYAEGNATLVSNFKEYANSIISDEMKRAFEFAYVEFVVNETGGIEDVRMKVSTEYDDIDQQLMEFIESMPEWNPARNAEGENVKQRFEFSINTNAGC